MFVVILVIALVTGAVMLVKKQKHLRQKKKSVLPSHAGVFTAMKSVCKIFFNLPIATIKCPYLWLIGQSFVPRPIQCWKAAWEWAWWDSMGNEGYSYIHPYFMLIMYHSWRDPLLMEKLMEWRMEIIPCDGPVSKITTLSLLSFTTCSQVNYWWCHDDWTMMSW